ncbi:hypothetical protein NHX12_013074 [Muraenolepis orangiensis]|uniref:G-patch domain and KOW motifs-containing protein n=1 Tax=Muraenolepis orangiensis TaxID=630683 RepID=A0A9Q0I6I6_9TELE|nr:hypothetical protein NHX12_013074 [Muraenolepis orangiensis]
MAAAHGGDTTLPESGECDGEKKAAVSFGFSKTVNKFKPSNDPAITNDEPDYLIGIDGKELLSTRPSDKPKELIIPLIQKNRWCDRRDNATRDDKNEAKPLLGPPEDDSVESQAVKELIEDSQRQQEKWQNGPQPVFDLSIPLLMQNQVPQGFEDGDKVKVDLRPESNTFKLWGSWAMSVMRRDIVPSDSGTASSSRSTNADYDSVPVEAYGIAMLKGMGWNQEEGIGRTFKQDLEPKARRRLPKPGDEPGKEEELVLGPGGCVLVESGAHKELYGKIEGVDPDNARVMVKLAIGGKTVTISLLSKAHKEREKRKEKEKEIEKEKESHRKEDEKRNGDEKTKYKSSERDRHRGKDERKRKHRDSSPQRGKPAVKEPCKLPAVPCWLQRDLKVRFIDKVFKGGRYYNSKMRVEDVMTSATCLCRTEEGRLLDDVKQSMLETIVPKNDSEAVMVVLGQHRGQVGRILQRDKDGCKALVQLERYEEEVFNLDYDTICHYIGGVDH